MSFKKKLKPASVIINRLRWDNTIKFNTNNVFIGYFDKKYNCIFEKSLIDWETIKNGGDIPEHSIQYFILKNNININDDIKIWDKKNRIDLLFGSGFTTQNDINNFNDNIIQNNCDIKSELNNESKNNESKNNENETLNLLDELIDTFAKDESKNELNWKYKINYLPNALKNVKNKSKRDAKLDAGATLKVIKDGYYYNNGNKIDISNHLMNCKLNTVLYHSKDGYQFIDKNNFRKYNETIIEITNETTVHAINRIYNDASFNKKTDKLCTLNFASANNPGGGFMRGAKAQEESLCCASILYDSLIKYQNEFYNYHKNFPNNYEKFFYSDSIIYSPNIIVFKDDNGNIYNNGYNISSFVTSPAVNAGMVLKKDTKLSNEEKIKIIKKRMIYRINKIYDVCLRNNNNILILGAFGCGVFKNNVNDMANIFADVLKNEYNGCFKKIIFAIYERGKSIQAKAFIKAFQ